MRGPRWGASLRQKSQGPRGGDGPPAKLDEKKADDGPEPREGSNKRVRKVRQRARPGGPSGNWGRQFPTAEQARATCLAVAAPVFLPEKQNTRPHRNLPASPPAALFLVAGARGNQVAFSQGTGTEEPHWAGEGRMSHGHRRRPGQSSQLVRVTCIVTLASHHDGDSEGGGGAGFRCC